MNFKTGDIVMTPEYLCKEIVEHYQPAGKVLEPCKGTGNFLKYFPEGSDWCEITEGRDFLNYNETVDWIITNPPFSKKCFTPIWEKALKTADNIVFLCRISSIFSKKRIKLLKQYGFGIKEIWLIETPKEWKGIGGLQIGCVYLKKQYNGDIIFHQEDIKYR